MLNMLLDLQLSNNFIQRLADQQRFDLSTGNVISHAGSVLNQ
jgi:hypothetical protein